MIQAVAFDMDDTLYPEISFVFSGYRAVSDAIETDHGTPIYEELVQLFQSGQRGDLFTPVLRRHLKGVEEAYVKRLVKVYREHEPHISAFPEARKALEDLNSRYRIGLISDGHLGVQQRKLEALGMGHLFEVVVLSDQWGRAYWKPHQRPYEVCAQRLGVDPTSMVYVGDNPAKDFITARKLGMLAIRVRRDNTLHKAMTVAPEQDADHIVSNLSDVVRLLSPTDG